MKKVNNWIRLLGIGGFLFLLLFTSATFTPALADAGWQRENPEDENSAWVYLTKDGGYLQNAWKKSGGQFYYLDENGRMAVNTLVEFNGDTYYVGDDGAKVTSQWVSMPNTGDALGKFIDTVYYYFNSVGKAYKNCKKTIDGSIYLFDEEGRMLSGWQTYGDDSDLYYLGTGEEGWAYTGWHYLESDSEGAGGPGDMNWFYFQPNTGKAYRDARKQINGFYYQFDSSGAMIDKWFFGTSNDASYGAATSSSTWYMEENGRQGTGWVYTYAPDDLNEERDKEWYYLDRRGVPFNEHAKDTYQTDHPNYNLAIDTHNSTWISGAAAKVIKNKTYLFDESGKMMTGVYYLICVKREGGAVLGAEGGFYYFNNREGSNQGQMMTGRQTVENDGEKEHYYIRSNGMLYTNIIIDSYLYNPNGLRMSAKDDLDYEVLAIPEGLIVKEKGNSRTHTKCQLLISKSGKLVKSGTIKADGIKYTIENYEIIDTEAY